MGIMLKRRIKEIIQIIEESSVNEVEVSTWWGRKIRVVKQAAGSGSSYSRGPIPSEGDVPAEGAHRQESGDQPALESPQEPSNHHDVRAPIVGTFYRSPSPESPVYINVGDTVTKGQIICIIEAMKLLNEIEADKAGVIKEILIENGQAVEYGQPLFVIG